MDNLSDSTETSYIQQMDKHSTENLLRQLLELASQLQGTLTTLTNTLIISLNSANNTTSRMVTLLQEHLSKCQLSDSANPPSSQHLKTQHELEALNHPTIIECEDEMRDNARSNKEPEKTSQIDSSRMKQQSSNSQISSVKRFDHGSLIDGNRLASQRSNLRLTGNFAQIMEKLIKIPKMPEYCLTILGISYEWRNFTTPTHEKLILASSSMTWENFKKMTSLELRAIQMKEIKLLKEGTNHPETFNQMIHFWHLEQHAQTLEMEKLGKMLAFFKQYMKQKSQDVENQK